MRFHLVNGGRWEKWLEEESTRWESLESALGHLNFFDRRYDERFQLAVATRNRGAFVVGVAAFCTFSRERRTNLRDCLEVHDLVAIGVDRNYQGHGVGRRLLRRFATRKVSRRVCGGGGMVVVRNWFTESLGFYEKIGFHRRTTFTRCASEWMEGADAGVLCWRYR